MFDVTEGREGPEIQGLHLPGTQHLQRRQVLTTNPTVSVGLTGSVRRMVVSMLAGVGLRSHIRNAVGRDC